MTVKGNDAKVAALQQAKWATARGLVSKSKHFADIDVTDLDALTRAIVSAPEEERLEFSTALSTILDNLPRPEPRPAGELIRAQISLLIAVGTEVPGREGVRVGTITPLFLPEWVPEGFYEVFQSRPVRVQKLIVRSWWERPAANWVTLWPAWQELVRRGVITITAPDMFALGAFYATFPRLNILPMYGRVPVPMDVQRDAAAQSLRAWMQADPDIIELVRQGHRDLRAHDHDSSDRVAAYVAMNHAGLLTTADLLEVNLDRLSQQPNKNESACHREVLDAVVTDIAEFAPHAATLTSIMAHGAATAQPWALDKLAALVAAGHALDLPTMMAGLTSIAESGALPAVKQALHTALSLGGADASRVVAIAALRHPKLPQQQAAWAVLSQTPAGDTPDALVEQVRDARASVLPAVAKSIGAWLGEAGGTAPGGTAPGGDARVTEANPVRDASPASAALPDRLPAAQPEHLRDLLRQMSLGRAGRLDDERLMALIAGTDPARMDSERRQAASELLPDKGSVLAWVGVDEHVSDSLAAWLRGAAPDRHPAMSVGKSLFGKGRLTYKDTRVELPDLLSPDSHARYFHHSGTCAQYGLTGLACARAWEAHFAATHCPGALLATPSLDTGAVTAADFADRLARTPSVDLRFDAIAAVLRLEPTCSDEAVVGKVAASKHPAATAVLALWGRAPATDVAAWLRPALESRSQAVSGPAYSTRIDAQAVARNAVDGEWPSLVWASGQRDVPARIDPLGAVQWYGGPNGAAVRVGEWSMGKGNPVLADIVPEAMERPFMVAPWNTDLVAGVIASIVHRIGSTERASVSYESWLLYALRRPVDWGEGWHALLAASALHQAAGLRAVAVDLLAAQPHHVDTAVLAAHLGGAVHAGIPGLGRASRLLADAAAVSRQAAVMTASVAALTLPLIPLDHRELGTFLEAWEQMCDAAQVGVTDASAREALVAASAGAAKRAKAAKRLLAL